jgi:hypothetical protein
VLDQFPPDLLSVHSRSLATLRSTRLAASHVSNVCANVCGWLANVHIDRR